jgi:hypothetical protein
VSQPSLGGFARRVLLTKDDSGCAEPDRIGIELNRSVMSIAIGSAPWAIRSAARKHTQSTLLLRVSLLTNFFMTPASKAGILFDESNVTRRTGVFRGESIDDQFTLIPLVFDRHN